MTFQFITNNSNDLTTIASFTQETKATNPTKPVIEKVKRKQVKNACVNCQKACKKCDDGRPCKRCIKLGITATCRDSDRKERKKGVKRGPYKKRQVSNKDKPVYPKLTEEKVTQWQKPIYETVPQVTSYTTAMIPSLVTSTTPTASKHSAHHSISSLNSFFEDDNIYVPSQNGLLQLSPTNTIESDENLYLTYGYGPNSMSSPSTTSMLDHQTTFSGNVTPIQETFTVWDDQINDMTPIVPMNYYSLMNQTQYNMQQPYPKYDIQSPTIEVPTMEIPTLTHIPIQTQYNHFYYYPDTTPIQPTSNTNLDLLDFTVPSQSHYVQPLWNY